MQIRNDSSPPWLQRRRPRCHPAPAADLQPPGRMKLDRQAIRLLGRTAERAAMISRNPHRYEVDAQVLDEILGAAERLEALLARVETIKVGETLRSLR